MKEFVIPMVEIVRFEAETIMDSTSVILPEDEFWTQPSV